MTIAMTHTAMIYMNAIMERTTLHVVARLIRLDMYMNHVLPAQKTLSTV